MLRTSVWILHQCQNVFQRTFSTNIGRTTCATRVRIVGIVVWWKIASYSCTERNNLLGKCPRAIEFCWRRVNSNNCVLAGHIVLLNCWVPGDASVELMSHVAAQSVHSSFLDSSWSESWTPTLYLDSTDWSGWLFFTWQLIMTHRLAQACI